MFGFNEVASVRAGTSRLRGRTDRHHARAPVVRAGGREHRRSHYALTFIRGARIQGRHHVLVNGATGAIGSATVQFLKGLGATVTAVCDTDHIELVRGLGADRIVDYTAQDFTHDEQKYDVVIDAVGKSSFARCTSLLKPRGIYLSSDLGRLSQNPVLALVTPLFGGRKVAFPIQLSGCSYSAR